MNDEDALTALCQRLGSTEPQARIMARQLLKRATQLAAERGMSSVEAIQHLLRLVMEGSQGKAPAGFEGGRPPEPPTPSP